MKDKDKTKQQEPPTEPISPSGNEEIPQPGEITHTPARSVSAGRTVKAVELVKQYTVALIAMVHEGDLLCEIRSKIYQMELPVKGRTETMQPARIVDVINLQTGEYQALICNETMVSAFERAGQETPIIGRFFALKCGDMVADKRYRMVDVVEVQVEFEPAGA